MGVFCVVAAIYGKFVGVVGSIDRGMIQISWQLCCQEFCVLYGLVYG
jgi:hypothetical protein